MWCSVEFAVKGWIVKKVFLDEVAGQIYRYVFPVWVRFFEMTFELVVKDFSVHSHEITFNIHFHDIARFGVVLATTSHVVFEPANTKKRTFAYSARIAIVDKSAVKHGIQMVKDPMMHHSVSKVGSKDLSFDGFLYNKGNAL